MQKSMMAIMLASAVSLSACATSDPMAGDIAQGAAVGAAGGAAIGAVVPGVNVIEGAAIGAGIGGLAGAVWADNNNDGYADGYVQNGQYYAGTPSGYDPTLRRVATGALGGAALGAAAGALIPGLGILEGAVVGAALGGVAGAVWADNDRDGRVDGYVQNGQYYQGAPQGYDPNMAPAPAPMSSGERG
ncbi:glycine zipper domain-containing protein [Sphingomonas sp. LY29]|uniref:glycine zipper domain-containing protein n=1 Tax=unclassified Sphingomonas TaxID=196159 RepID=UPI002ADECD88|nr:MULTISPECIES: glycine zipper domain-containing protein [unclassified Sphingomonas]MEA1073109.1 glycine zipper domain-containing protein [Sphingomonas sp. LY160]WRP26539.1 glycine zipper domain-containing protein [Sphingomonas sp. LY29]